MSSLHRINIYKYGRIKQKLQVIIIDFIEFYL